MDTTINGYPVAIPDPPTGPIQHDGKEWWAVEYRAPQHGDFYACDYRVVERIEVLRSRTDFTPICRWIMAPAPAPPEGWRVVGPFANDGRLGFVPVSIADTSDTSALMHDGKRHWVLERIPPPPRVRRVVENR